MADHAPDDRRKFEHLAEEAQQSFVKEVWYLIASDKRWWLAPIVVAIAILGVLVMLSSTGVGPFIYTLF
jgi:uncharacterized protein DUF5989